MKMLQTILQLNVIVDKFSNFFENFYTEKNSLVKFIELCKSWGYRHLRNRVLQNL